MCDEVSSYCADAPRINRALVDLARICKAGSESGRPSGKPWLDADAWQNAYVSIAARISEGKVDIERPLEPLARVAAFRHFLSDHRRQGRFFSLSEVQHHRYYAGESSAPEDGAEAARRVELLRAAVRRLRMAGALSDTELKILWRRYVEEWTSVEVGAAAGLAPENVRQLCARRCGVLAKDLAGQELAA